MGAVWHLWFLAMVVSWGRAFWRIAGLVREYRQYGRDDRVISEMESQWEEVDD